MADKAAVQEADFPGLRGSPLWIESERRERWWFSDGAWVDQGQLGAPVSFSLTNWCADRGLREGPFDREYALALHRDVNVAMGQDPEADLGERTPVALQVLQSRGLVGAVYRCDGVAEAVAAVLEHGPVLAGVAWTHTMGTPERVGDAFVAHRQKDDQVVGGHAVVLDGVDLDLELGGVTGFVRFKNTWGRGWADAGHCLVSVEDLGDAISEAYLPLPEPGALRTGVDPAEALAGERPESLDAETRYGEQSIGSDRWTIRDRIGYAAHAEAIARAIGHPDTSPPLTVGIKGPWGAGKTSLMRMVRDRLEWPAGRPQDKSPDDLREIHLTSKDARTPITNRMLLRALRTGVAPAAERAAPTVDAAHAAQGEPRWRPTVWFNPWMYQTGEQVWAGLAHEIIRQVTSRMSTGEQERFWLRLNLARIDEQAVRRRVYALIFTRVIPWAIGGLVLLVAGLVVLAAGAPAALGATLAGAGPGAALVGGAATVRTFLGERTRGALADALRPAAFEELVRSPDYEARSGPLFLVRTDVRRVLDLVATPQCPLVVFVDDLDRCNPGTVVQVIEAINLFVAGEDPNLIFVVAMEPEMVAAHVEAAYKDLVAQLRAEGHDRQQSFDLGWRFLEKIVQLPLSLPSVGAERVQEYVGSLFSPAAVAAADRAHAPSEVSVQEAEERLAGASIETAVERGGAALGGVQPAAVREAVRRVVERRLSTDSPDVQAVVGYAARQLDANPREIKRFVNVFRSYVMIATERRLQGLAAAVPLDALAKLAVLGIRWPGLLPALTERVDDLDGRPTVFTLLERRDVDDVRATVEACGLGAATVDRLMGEELTAFLVAEPHVGAATDGFL
jgi:hypothetical protein